MVEAIRRARTISIERTDSNIYERFRGLATAAAFAGLFAYAVVLFITPASNNEIARAYDASYGMLARLPLAVMAGFIPAVLFAGHYADRHGKLPTVFAGCVSMSLGLTLFGSTSSFAVLTVASLMMGIGGGLSESTAMALISDLYHDNRRTSMANLSQAAFSLGAVTSPFAIGWLLREGVSFRVGYFGAAVLCVLSAGVALSALLMRQERPLARRDEGVRWQELLRDPLVLALSAGILLYVGAEIGQSNWLAVYFERYLGSAKSVAAASLSFMWFGIGLGRIAAAWASRYVRELSMIRLCLAGAAICQAVLLLVHAPYSGLAAAFGLGFFLGPVFPTIISCAGGAYPGRSGAVTATVVAAGATGGLIFPPGIGWAADSIGLRTALWTCFAILAVDVLMFLVVRTRTASGCGEPGASADGGLV